MVNTNSIYLVAFVIFSALLVCCGVPVAPQPSVSNRRHPVLLVPGVGGSVLNSLDLKKGTERRVWVDVINADYTLMQYLLSQFNETTNKTRAIHEDTEISVPMDDFGLFAITSLDPKATTITTYMQPLVKYLTDDMGLIPGATLFGAPYDWRQSTSDPDTMSDFLKRVEVAYHSSGGLPVDIVSHSLGGLVVRSFMATHPNEAAKYVRTWVSIATPWRGGAAGNTMGGLLYGFDLNDPLVKDKDAHQIEMSCPSFYDAYPDLDYDWTDTPQLTVCMGGKTITYDHSSAISFIRDANANNTATVGLHTKVPQHFNDGIWNLSQTTRDLWRTLPSTFPSTVKYVGVVGVGHKTVQHIGYNTSKCASSDFSPADILEKKPKWTVDVDGDGTVTRESASGDLLPDHIDGTVHTFNATHGGLMSDSGVHQLLSTMLTPAP